MKKRVAINYKLRLNAQTGDIINSHCECPAGKGPHGTCKHIAAVILLMTEFVEEGRVNVAKSCTEAPFPYVDSSALAALYTSFTTQPSSTFLRRQVAPPRPLLPAKQPPTANLLSRSQKQHDSAVRAAALDARVTLTARCPSLALRGHDRTQRNVGNYISSGAAEESAGTSG